ncbi:MAG: phosphoribosylformylglycinamidine synthase subunit PurS [Endomicrobium sp.]|jgi:phosphoribosylformylglycinamidine synthase|nr:phosphoribosylformylglycinamidine synthase subunit PurS [Endomicrobium sp.]
MFRIEVFTKKCFKNLPGEHVLADICGIGIKNITKVDYSTLYIIDGSISYVEAKIIASKLLIDKITEAYVVHRYFESLSKFAFNINLSIIEVLYKKDVTDTVSESVVKAVKDLGIVKEIKVKTGCKYYLYGKSSYEVLNKIVTKLLANTLIQEYRII